MSKPEIRSRIKDLHKKIDKFESKSDSIDAKRSAESALAFLDALGRHLDNEEIIFGEEPWHILAESGTYLSPVEYLLRLKNKKGEPISPYSAIMAFYDNGYIAEIDTIIFLCALEQFKEDKNQQVSVNISARSLHSPDFVKLALGGMEELGMAPNRPERIIIEIHESTADVMSQEVLRNFRQHGASFAIDDVGLSISDVFRLSEFDGVADYIKIDRKAVMADQSSTHSLDHVMGFVRALLPGVIVVAEGVKTVEHAVQIHKVYPDIDYVQGLHLPDREMFGKRWRTLASANSRR